MTLTIWFSPCAGCSNSGALYPQASTSSLFNEGMPATSDSSAELSKNLFDLSDDAIVNILKTLPDEDACKVRFLLKSRFPSLQIFFKKKCNIY